LLIFWRRKSVLAMPHSGWSNFFSSLLWNLLWNIFYEIRGPRRSREALGGGRGSGAAKSPEWAFS
jgi:hypothetical protein